MDEAVKAELARLRDEDNRQNHRIDDLEQSVKGIQDLTISVHALAQDMRQMLSELKDQGSRLERFDGRLEALEQKPAKRWQADVGQGPGYGRGAPGRCCDHRACNVSCTVYQVAKGEKQNGF